MTEVDSALVSSSESGSNLGETRLLHIAAMPFPTRQGTQVCVDAMCRACAEAGLSTHLLSYGQGVGVAYRPYTLHGLPSQIGGVRPVDHRSGPSLRKVVSDVRLIRAIRDLVQEIQPTQVIAHHVEAAILCQFARVPYSWVAHTDLGAELPGYFERGARTLERAGEFVDQLCVQRARGVAAVSPLLAQQLGNREDVHVLPTPWLLDQSRVSQDVRKPELIYAGNLDGYQGWEDLVDALGILAKRGQRLRCTLLTASDPTPWLARAEAQGVLSELRIVRNGGEEDRLYAMRRTQIALVPRRVPGGLPIKLLDHWSLGHAVIAQQRALAGYPAERALMCVADDDPEALAEAIHALVADVELRHALARSGRNYLATAHNDATFLRALSEWLKA